MKRGPVSFAACTLAAFVFGCNGINSPSQEAHFTGSRKTNGYFVVMPLAPVIVRNAYGPVIVTGASTVDSMGWFIDASVTANSRSDADNALNGFAASESTVGDTTIIQVTFSSIIVGATPSSLFSLQIPYATPCIIDRVAGDIDVADLDSTLTIWNAYNVNIARQSGSCQVSSTTGNVRMEVAIPDSGYCIASVGRGNCVVTIPASTSAYVSEKVTTGMLSQSGLIFGSSSQQGGLFSGTLGSGSGIIRLVVGVGNITLQGE